MVGMITLLTTTPSFWLCVLLVPFTALIPDISLMAINVTAFTSETDQIRLAEAAKKDPGPFILDTEKGLQDRNAPNINVNRTISSGTGVDEMEMTRGYAFSQEEGGAVSQTEYIRRYDTTSATNRSKIRLSGGT